MSIAALIADMVRAGVDPAIIGRTAELLASREATAVVVRDEQAERRREADRERKAFRRIPQNSADFPSPEVSLVSPTPPSNHPNPIPSKTPPKGGQKGSPEGEALLLAEGVTASALADWKAVRKAKSAGPITRLAAEAIIREASRAGISPADAIRTAAERGWQSFRADWQGAGPANARGQPPPGAPIPPCDVVFIAKADAKWDEIASRYHQRHGKRLVPLESKYGGLGRSFTPDQWKELQS